jgi:hypothetical protein
MSEYYLMTLGDPIIQPMMPQNGAMKASPGTINNRGMPNDFVLEAGLKQCIIMIPVRSKSIETSAEYETKEI